MKETPSEKIIIQRFDQDLAEFDTTKFEASEAKLRAKYGDLYTFYIERMMGIGSLDPANPYYYKPHLSKFLSDEYPSMMDSFRRYVFNEIPRFEDELGECYDILKNEFPEKKNSKIYSFFVSPMAANPSAAFSYGQDTIGINWFYYLGKDFSLYRPLFEGYTYMVEWNQPNYLSRNVMLVEYNLLYEKYKEQTEYSELIYHMIEKGKQFYFLDKVCPKAENWTKIGFSEEEYQWCEKNEFEIWAYLTENKLLYSTDPMDIKRLTEEGPNTPGMPAESPGMVGGWVGWQIVKKYMSDHPHNLKKLLSTSPKEILKKSGYKPKK